MYGLRKANSSKYFHEDKAATTLSSYGIFYKRYLYKSCVLQLNKV